jgi:hypothetical protein
MKVVLIEKEKLSTELKRVRLPQMGYYTDERVPIKDENGNYERYKKIEIDKIIHCCEPASKYFDECSSMKDGKLCLLINADDEIEECLEITHCPFCGEKTTYEVGSKYIEYPEFEDIKIDCMKEIVAPKYEKYTETRQKMFDRILKKVE